MGDPCGGALCYCASRLDLEEGNTMTHRRPTGPPGRPDRAQRDEERVIATLDKNSAEEVRVSLSTFKGYDLISARVWTDPEGGDGERRPTRKGLTLRVELLPQLLEALQQAAEEALKAGMIDHDEPEEG